MKIIHISDLHLGKRVNKFSMIEDQDYILKRILDIIDGESADKPVDCVVIAGDVYDRSVPPEEAVSLFDGFLVELSRRNLPVMVISGNHDSAGRISFASRLMRRSGVYVSPVFSGDIEPVVLEDEYGEVRFYLLPYIKPGHVRAAYEDADVRTYSDAVKYAVDRMNIDTSARNVIVAHQFVAGSIAAGSEELTVGGTDAVGGDIFKPFDYTALGHIHKPQLAYGERIRYCGSPLKYSFSEASHVKKVLLVELGEKKAGEEYCRISISEKTLDPMRDIIEIRGHYDEIMSQDFYSDYDTDAYFHITLIDEEDIPNAIGNLRRVYRNIMKLDYDNIRTREMSIINPSSEVTDVTPVELFEELYIKQNGQGFSDIQRKYVMDTVNEPERRS